MDQIHEELKQPLPFNEEEHVEQDDNKELSSDQEDRIPTRTSFIGHDRQVSVDSSSSSQSDEFYETSDSIANGNGHSSSSNENTSGIDNNDTSNNASRIKTSPKIRNRKNNESCSESAPQKSAKEKKDTTNEKIALGRNEDVENGGDKCQEVRKSRVQHMVEGDTPVQKMTSVQKRGKDVYK
jgi:hypothetical protein